MKILILSIALLSSVIAAKAQTMYIWQKGVGIAVNEGRAGDIQFSADGTAFTVQGKDFNTQAIDSITFGTETVDPLTVGVNYDETAATAILPVELADSITIDIDGAYVSAISSSLGGDEVTYTLTGESQNGNFFQDGEYKCTVVLNGVSLTSQRGAAIDIQNGKRIDIEVVDGTTNTFVDCAGGEQKACFFVNGHPEFKGSGTVNITGNTKHAYASDEYTRLKHSAGTFNILSAAGGDGMHIKQYLQMEGGNIIVRNVADDGIQVEITNDETDEMNGQMIIQNGKMDIEVNSPDVKALRSDSLMTINGGTIKLEVTGDGSKGMTTDTDIYVDETVAPVNVNIHCTGGEYTDPADPTDTKKCHGINVKGNLTIMGGTFDISSTGKKGKSIKVDGISKKAEGANVTTNPSYYFDFII